MLGPLGGRQFDKLDKVDINTISDQINAWKDKGIISEEKAQKLRERVGLILDVRNEVK